MDALPVFSQIKSFVQAICGQREAAWQTQIHFSRQCPVVSQIRSAVEVIKGDKKAARDTQIEFVGFLQSLVNGVPVVGHIKGGVHYALGDTDGGDAAIKAASHTSGVMAGGTVGFLVAGPVGAVALGIGSGAAMDATITVVDSKLTGKLQPYGFIEPFADPTNAGKWCDAVGGVVLDGVAARAAGKMVQRIQKRGAGRSAVIAAALEDDVIVRNVRPFSNSNLITVVMMVKAGVVYLLQDGNLKKIQDIYSQIFNMNTVSRTFNTGKFVIKISGNLTEIYEGNTLIFLIRNNTVYVKDARGNEVELQEDHVYTKNPAGEVEEIHEKRTQDRIQEVIRESEESSDVCSLIDTESVYLDTHDHILDLEEDERFHSPDDVLLDTEEEEHQRLLNNCRETAKSTN